MTNSTYKGVIVNFDEDYDLRVLSVIDNLTDFDRENLISIHEREASLFVELKKPADKRTRLTIDEEFCVADNDGYDYFNIVEVTCELK